MVDPRWKGARWWKFDFHTHTPASKDYGKGPDQEVLRSRSPREWLLDFMRAGIDCVAVTDHNTGEWIDRLREALSELESERPEGFRELTLFPGVEITVNGGVHVLAILPSNSTASKVTALLGAVKFAGTDGDNDGVTQRSFPDVIAEIIEAGGIAIPAHVDGPKGLFELPGTTLAPLLDSLHLFAMEVLDSQLTKPELYTQKQLDWTEVLGSDSHHPCPLADHPDPRYPGSHFTWVKMGEPTLEGLRLALIDGRLSVRRSDEEPGDPNAHGALRIESVDVRNARYMGRKEPFTLGLNPWLNAIVGGRGTGKSSLIEFLRIAMRRDKELPEELRGEFDKYGRVYPNRHDGGLLASGAEIRVQYRKDGQRYRIQWSEKGDLPAIEEELDGEWREAKGEITERFPIRIFSQKQIFHLAKAPRALLGVVDEAEDVDRRSWRSRWNEEESRFLSLRARAREIDAGLAEKSALEGRLADVKRQLTIFEETGHAGVLKSYQQRQRQQRAIQSWMGQWADTGVQLRQVAEGVLPDELDESTLEAEPEEAREIFGKARSARNRLDEIRGKLMELASQADEVLAEWADSLGKTAWSRRYVDSVEAYEELKERLAREEAGDPSAYGEKVQERQALEQRLANIEERREQASRLRQQAQEGLERLKELRRELTQSRRAFLERVLSENAYVQIEVVPFGAREAVEAELRKLLQRENGGFEKDIGEREDAGLRGQIYEHGSEAEEIERGLRSMKDRVRSIAEDGQDKPPVADQRFAAHLAKLPPESLDRLDAWFPEDSLAVQYSPTGDGKKPRAIEDGSPGQKTAALLAFLLSYGNEPLVLDQPEDDLDNHLIYELIVRQLREVKRHRQVLIVTHNPNIVVNGDAELVAGLRVREGQTELECFGSLQEKAVRECICQVMEGGREAFEQRYRRIALESRRV